ncbi:type I polyketide synthase [Streptomyces niveus]|uniref:type I polyketide synthase n=1 Tax=Streptomyces niveus TaxID=193462 RepID=UPI0037900F60
MTAATGGGPDTDALISELRRELAELRSRTPDPGEPVAVVGSACRLPGGADTPDALWESLRAGRDLVGPLTGERWSGVDFDGLDDPAFGRIPRHAALLDSVDGFDSGFFGISSAEADLMDPQQRLTLEAVWECAERAGWTPDEMRRTPTGIFLGVGHQDYLLTALAAGDGIGSRLATGTARNMIANRVSYELGLRGPSIAVDTACSSSLVALHLACQSLRTGESGRAVAGGVSLILSPLSSTLTGRALPMAPDGRCKAFAADADGMVRGEGLGVVALKRLSDALADGDPIEAVILATATNQDGRTNGLTAPSPVAQSLLLSGALKASGLAPSDITLVETHGTGTPLGDPIEFSALRDVYGATADDPICWLGSVKANLGHLEFAAGIASVLKTLGALKHGTVPPQINIDALNPRIDLTGQRFAIARQEESWTDSARRYAAVSSFGFGGTNAHAILAHPDAVPAVREARTAAGAARRHAPDTGGPAVLMPLSARSPEALAAHVDRTARALEGAPAAALTAAASTAARRRAHHPVRVAVTAESAQDLPAAVRRAGERLATTGPQRAGRPRLAFVYSGQSGQWPRMGMRLADRDPHVADELARWDEAVTRAGGPPLLKTLRGPDSARALKDTRFAQIGIVALQLAVTARLRAWGLTPDAVTGHSVGEVAAAVAAGSLGRTEAVRVLLARGEALHRHATGGAMLAVRAGAAEVQALLDRLTERDASLATVGIAALNAPGTVVLSGPASRLAAVQPLLHPWRTTPLETDYAFHSPGLGPAAEEIRSALGGLRTKDEDIALFSTTTGGRVDGRSLDAEHWAENAARPVRFTEAVDTLFDAGVTAFAEIGPHPALTSHLRRALRDRGVDGVAVSTLRGERHEAACLWKAVGDLWAAGCDVNWEALHPGPPDTFPLPTYPWQRRAHWIPGTRSPAGTGGPPQTAVAESPPGQASPFSATAPSSPAAVHDGPGAARAHQAHDDDPGARVLALLLETVAEAMEVDPGALSVDHPTRDFDVDSVVFVELKSRLENELGTAIPLTALTEGASLREIARRLALPERRLTSNDEARAALERIDELSEAEVAELLSTLENREEW